MIINFIVRSNLDSRYAPMFLRHCVIYCDSAADLCALRNQTTRPSSEKTAIASASPIVSSFVKKQASALVTAAAVLPMPDLDECDQLETDFSDFAASDFAASDFAALDLAVDPAEIVINAPEPHSSTPKDHMSVLTAATEVSVSNASDGSYVRPPVNVEFYERRIFWDLIGRFEVYKCSSLL